jgi:hypothetical protein
MSENLQKIIDRIEAGNHTQEDVLAIVSEIYAGKLVLASGSGAVAIGGDPANARIATGNQNVIGDRNTVIYIYGAESEVIQSVVDRYSAIDNTFQRLFTPSASSTVDWEWGMKLLKQKQLPEIRKRLTDTLGFDRVLMDVSIEERQNWVNRSHGINAARSPLAADRTLQIDGRDCGILDANKMLIETFGRDDIKGKLLILGAPGAGKTTALLSLAEQLVEGAISQPRTVIPVIFELSTWRNDNQSIQDWLIEQLYDLHGGNRKSKLYEKWLERQILLPLLDGLDELGLERQKKCTQKLNEFAEHYPQLVVCCRVKEFETVDIKLRNLRGAVCLQSLADSQIQDYFDSLQRPELWDAIQTTPYLQSMLEPNIEGDPGLLRVPLFVKLVADVYDPQQPFFGKSNLLDRYINKQLSLDTREVDRRKELKKRRWAYQSIQQETQPDITCKYLHWVAKYLKHQNQIDFLIESIQPSLLGQAQFKYYCFVFILIIILITHLINFVNTGEVATSFLGSLILGSIFGAFHINQRFEPVEYFKFNFNQQTLQKGKIGLIAGGITGAIVSIIFAIYFVLNTNASAGLTVGIILALAIIPIMALTMSIVFGMKQDLKIRSRPNEGILNSFKNMFFSSSLSYLMSVVFSSMYIIQLPLKTAILESKPSTMLWQLVQASLTKAVGQSLIIALFFGFAFGGGMACIQHVSTRLVMCKASILPLNMAQFLKYCDERKLIHSIGGRYRFIHRELLDHFAQLNH